MLGWKGIVGALSFWTQGISPALRMALAISVFNALGFVHMTAIDRIKPFAEGKDDVHVVIDTPRGSRNKLKWTENSAS
jgi:hypothetical protein